MIYTYECECGKKKEVVKDHTRYKETEVCECGGEMRKVFTPLPFKCYQPMGVFNPGLGEVIHSEGQKKEIMKRKGLIEVGHEDVEKNIETVDQRIDREWRELD
jgi:hypothetical protein